ncbi:hypothetical protein DWW91_14170 [Parabacteroides sp. AF17-3]|uniref:hypothetical protein n=1 Tax=Parabacteroides sp. AF17-3 TaxID=2293113 RepID=UPI000F006508|nr:hypothetical protein [Parabacteroides sp. AF17-3]RKU67960.1 hypothetical protein DWW91_14170 [Parabacteroides sp. AF17-3]
MNIREILGLILLFIFVASCSEESPIDEHPYETGTFTLQFTMNDGVNTKATAEISGANEVPGHADGYSYSTESELKVNNCFIAVFAKGDDDAWSKKIYANLHTGINTQSGSFTILGLTLPIKTDLMVIAIANCPTDGSLTSSNNSDMVNWSYSDWKSASVLSKERFDTEHTYYTFNPESLIKQGECEMRFNASGNLIDANDQVKEGVSPVVPLSQLAAKVRLNLSVSDKMYFKMTDGIQKDESKYGVSISKIKLYSGIWEYKVGNSDSFFDAYYKKASGSSVQKVDDIVFYTYEQPHYDDDKSGLTVQMTGQMSKTQDGAFSVENTYTLYINPAITKGLVRGNYYEVTGTLKMDQSVITNLNYEVVSWNEETVNIPSFN